MKNILYLLSVFFLFSCESVDWYSTLEENDNAQEVLNQLNDPELRKGKIFVFSQHIDERVIAKIRINGEVFLIKRDELQSFELKEGDNSLYTYLVAFGDEVSNCAKEPYIFNTKDFESYETHYFLLWEIKEGGKMFDCIEMFMLQKRDSIILRRTLDQDGNKVGCSTITNAHNY